MIVVELTNNEMSTLNLLASMRSWVARANGVIDRKMSDGSGIQIDIDGLIGEYGFCKYYNLFMDITVSARSGTYDILSRKNSRIDIKTTRYKNGRLLCTLKDNPDIDIYVLGIIENNKVTFVGWVYKNELRKEENIKDLGHGKGYSLEQSQLRSFTDGNM